jgi:recombination protein RecT
MTEQTTITPLQNIKTFLERDDVAKKFQEILGKRASSYLTSVLSVVSQNELLQKASPQSIYMASLTSATLDLPINQNLGFAYIVPYA